ncbi:MAG: exodeoxyribonuclease VII large subunit [Deltaproteobacteria bacterium]
MPDPSIRVVVPEHAKAISVGEFNRIVKGSLEERFPSVWIGGEIASCKIAASGHAYFDLKDEREEARVSCCLFRAQMARVRANIRDGERVIVRARASLYPARGSFQLIVDTMLPAGAGSAAAALDALKRKLEAEGLFAPERKRRLPRFPRVLGVVTSQQGAAFGDICRVAHHRWPVRIVLAPTLVQGADAPAKIVAAIQAIQRVKGLDVLIVGRGGGSSEDLSAFNDERVARAIAACRVPVISAVGHEVDHTIADLVADRRAATPSNAAEIALPEQAAVQAEFDAVTARLEHTARGGVNQRRVALARLEKRLGDPRRVTDEVTQRFDDALARMREALRRKLTAGRRTLDDVQGRLKGAHPRTRLARDRGLLEGLAYRLGPASRRLIEARRRAVQDGRARLTPALRARLTANRAALGTQAARLDALSPLAILARGYSIALAGGRVLIDATQVDLGDTVRVRLHRGEIDAEVSAVRKS